jgi:hypothetical protein
MIVPDEETDARPGYGMRGGGSILGRRYTRARTISAEGPPVRTYANPAVSAAILVASLAIAACGGSSKAVPTPPGGFVGGGADASVKIGDKAWEYKDGICEKGGNDRYLSVNIGNPAGDEYFGLVVGQYPGVDGTPKAATGGGEFTGQSQTVVTFRHETKLYLVKFDSTKVTLPPGLASGAFTSELTAPDDGGTAVAVSGTFVCTKAAGTATP